MAPLSFSTEGTIFDNSYGGGICHIMQQSAIAK